MFRKFKYCAVLLMMASPALAEIDPCAVGTWSADLNDLADIFGSEMGGSARSLGGSAYMVIEPGGNYAIGVNEVRFELQMPGVPTMQVEVGGASRGSFYIWDTVWHGGSTDNDLVGSADVLGQRMVIPINSADGFFGGLQGWYECNATTLHFETHPSERLKHVRYWTRI